MSEIKNLFQSPAWEEFKLKTGYQKSYRIEDVLVLQKSLPLGFSMLYSPLVSKQEFEKIADLSGFLQQIKKIGQKNNTIFYRLELDSPISSVQIPDQFTKSFEEMQPEHTEIIDLTKSEDELLAAMKPKLRYNIKLAQKNNISINYSEKSGTELDDFYAMYEATAKRHKITYRSKEYFASLLDILGPIGYARVYDAKAKIDGKDEPLAAAIVLVSDKKATYLFGSSSDQYKNLMAPHLLHWTIMQEMKQIGCEDYDLFGIAPNDDPNHPWAGITRFKKQFGGHQVDLVGSYDLVFSPIKYRLFKIAEKIRR